jgi:hypothetical protein
MKNLQNENKTDRLLRVVLAVIAAAIGYNSSGTTKIVCLIIAVVALISGLTGFSLFYKLVGINTLKK